jgi:hypothetical protein
MPQMQRSRSEACKETSLIVTKERGPRTSGSNDKHIIELVTGLAESHRD